LAMGIISRYIHMALARLARTAVLFLVDVPNALTAETLRKGERGEDVHHAEDADDLFRKLGI
jgi:DNA-damage-inducible protein J